MVYPFLNRRSQEALQAAVLLTQEWCVPCRAAGQGAKVLRVPQMFLQDKEDNRENVGVMALHLWACCGRSAQLRMTRDVNCCSCRPHVIKC